MALPGYDLLVADFVRIVRSLPVGLRVSTAGMFVCMFILALLEVMSLLSISFLAMSIAAPQSIAAMGIVQRIFRLFPYLAELCTDPRMLAFCASMSVVLLTAIKNVMAMYTGWKSACYGEKIALYAGETIFRQYLYSPYMWHLSGDSNVIFQALAWRGQLSALIVNFMMMYTYFITSIGLFLTLISATPEVLLLTIGVVLILCWATYASVKSHIDKSSQESARFGLDETVATRNAMHGIREVLIYRQQEVFFEKFSTACKGAVPSKAFMAIASPIPPWILEVVGFGIIPAAVWIMIVVYDAPMPQITGVITMIMLAAWRILPILSRSLGSLVILRSVRHAAVQCLESLERVLSEPIPLPSPPSPDFQVRKEIRFENISFRYPNAENLALEQISLAIPCGKRIGIIGPSGAGKSTIIGILSGLTDPTEGILTVDGQELSPGDRSAYAMQVGYVPQAPYILPGTLAENVAFSSWGKPFDEERVLKSCQMAALDIVEDHPQGILIPIGEHGAGLSGGQAQRVSIARALYTNPSLLIFDEATSALDHATESAILKTIYELPDNITTILIAHRLTTVEHCDYIFWIDHGKLVAEGKPEDILPRYQDLK